MLTRRARALTLGAVLTGVAVVAGAALPAEAGGGTSSRCTAPLFYWGNRGCTTGTISVGTSRSVDVYVQGVQGVRWQVWDTGTGVTVAAGIVNSSHVATPTIRGLYGTYRGKIWDANYNATISIGGY